ncbi:MAG: aspA, partial [Jatrophihabitans sp.]|nr:aspA [Jatrophihabitans sp.]
AESSPSIVTPLNHYVGYDEAGKIAKQELAERKTILEVVVERGHVPDKISEEKLDEVLDVLSMTKPKD